MVANLNTMVIYCGILTLENICTAENYCNIFITLALGGCQYKVKDNSTEDLHIGGNIRAPKQKSYYGNAVLF
jgi:hypothetical protein